jgi:hypothetical protein
VGVEDIQDSRGLRLRRLDPRREVAHPRDAEVEHLDRAVARQKQVRRLHVAMHDARRMSRRENVEHLHADGDRDRGGQLAASRFGQVFDRRAIEQLHDDVRGAVLRDGVVEHANGAGVLDRVGGVPSRRKRARRSGCRDSSGSSILTASSARFRWVAL